MAENISRTACAAEARSVAPSGAAPITPEFLPRSVIRNCWQTCANVSAPSGKFSAVSAVKDFEALPSRGFVSSPVTCDLQRHLLNFLHCRKHNLARHIIYDLHLPDLRRQNEVHLAVTSFLVGLQP